MYPREYLSNELDHKIFSVTKTFVKKFSQENFVKKCVKNISLKKIVSEKKVSKKFLPKLKAIKTTFSKNFCQK